MVRVKIKTETNEKQDTDNYYYTEGMKCLLCQPLQHSDLGYSKIGSHCPRCEVILDSIVGTDLEKIPLQ